MPIQHLLKQIETHSAKRGNRDVRPPWLTEFVNDVAELFEPLSGVGRVGFECRMTEGQWVAGLYLGSTEIVGGRDDGRHVYTDFEINLDQVAKRFTSIDEFYWSVFPSLQDPEQEQPRSYVTICGLVGEHPLRLQLFSGPPSRTGPGLRRLPDGRSEPM